jgi:hypothetical protein
MHSFDRPPADVTAAACRAADILGLEITGGDDRRGHLYIVTPFKPGKRTAQIQVSVTDNGLGGSSVHVAWEPAGSGRGGKAARRLVKRTGKVLSEADG